MNKHIEEMALVMVERALREYPSTTTGIDSKVAKDRFADIMRKYANDLYNAGYRKASDVATEIFEGIENCLSAYIGEICVSSSVVCPCCYRTVSHDAEDNGMERSKTDE